MPSSIWDHFIADKENQSSTCKYCNLTYPTKKGCTSNLWRHARSKHPVEIIDSDKEFDELCEKIVRFVASENLSFRTVENPSFRAFFGEGARLPTRWQLTYKVMPSMVADLQKFIKEKLHGKRVTLCIDQWTSKGGRITLSCFNIHYANEQGQLRSLVLAVPPLHGRHTADNLREQIEEVIAKFDLDVASVVTDSASNIRKALKDLGLFNPRCAAHQLHLAVTGAMSKWSHSGELNKLKEFARTLNKSSSFREEYFKACKDLGLKQVGVPQSVDTRWGSLFSTIKQSLQQWEAINTTLAHNGKEELSDETRLMLAKMSALLQPFDMYTHQMSSEDCPLTEVAFIFSQIIYDIKLFIEKENGPCHSLALLLHAQMEKRSKYYLANPEMDNLLFFEPRAIRYFEKKEWREIGSSLFASTPISSPPPSPEEKSTFVFAEKKARISSSTPITVEIEGYIKYCEQNAKLTERPLAFWNSPRAAVFPTIKAKALDNLSIPATSVSAERVFSAAGLLDKQRLRNQMSAEMMETCLLLRLNYIGDRAREISFKAPETLVPTIQSTIPNDDETYGYMSDESDFEEECSEDELEDEIDFSLRSRA